LAERGERENGLAMRKRRSERGREGGRRKRGKVGGGKEKRMEHTHIDRSNHL